MPILQLHRLVIGDKWDTLKKFHYTIDLSYSENWLNLIPLYCIISENLLNSSSFVKNFGKLWPTSLLTQFINIEIGKCVRKVLSDLREPENMFSIVYFVCCMLYVLCCMLYAVCCTYIVCCMLYVVCCMLYVVQTETDLSFRLSMLKKH